MQPLVRAAVFAGVLGALSLWGARREQKPSTPPVKPALFAPPIPAACGPRTVPEGDSCLPIGTLDTREGRGDLDMEEPSAGRDLPSARVLIPRRPDRPLMSSAYRFPLAGDQMPEVLGGFDQPLDLGPSKELLPLPGAVFLGAHAGQEIVTITLSGQQGPAEVAFVGEMLGATLVTAHLVEAGGKLRQVLVLHGNMGAFSQALAEGVPLVDGEVLGEVGDSAWPGRPGLYLEVLELREGRSLGSIDPMRLRDDVISVPSDPRNHLPLR